jgi:glycosyltransferase involved in cell wall biosynthesis
MNVSVVLTCHNEMAYIEQAIRSVVNQTAVDRIEEIVVIDDGSTDDSPRVLERLRRDIQQMRVIRTDGIGLPAARNVAIRSSRGKLFAFLDGDDYWTPDKLERQIDTFEQSPRIGLVYSDYVDFTREDASDAQLVNVRRFHGHTAQTLSEYFVHDGPIVPSTTLIPKAVFDDVGLFDETLRPGEDTEMFLRIAERWTFQHVVGGLTFKRRHGRNLTAHLQNLLPVNMHITRQFVARHPELKAIVKQRLSRRYARVGHDCAEHGQPALALGYLGRSVRYSPFFWRPYAYLAFMLLPRKVRPTLLRVGKRLFHGSLRKLRGGQMANASC